MLDKSFTKEFRLLSAQDFAQLKIGSKAYKRPSLSIYYKLNNLDHSRLGLTVSKKVGNSVTRNKFKRIIREHFRTCASLKFKKIDLVVIVHPFKKIPLDNALSYFSKDLNCFHTSIK